MFKLEIGKKKNKCIYCPMNIWMITIGIYDNAYLTYSKLSTGYMWNIWALLSMKSVSLSCLFWLFYLISFYHRVLEILQDT